MVTVDLPTPPLPAPTRTMFFTPGVMEDWATPGADRTRAPKRSSTRVAPAPRRAASTSLAMVSLRGQAGVVSSTSQGRGVPLDLEVLHHPQARRGRGAARGPSPCEVRPLRRRASVPWWRGYSGTPSPWQDGLRAARAPARRGGGQERRAGARRAREPRSGSTAPPSRRTSTGSRPGSASTRSPSRTPPTPTSAPSSRTTRGPPSSCSTGSPPCPSGEERRRPGAARLPHRRRARDRPRGPHRRARRGLRPGEGATRPSSTAAPTSPSTWSTTPSPTPTSRSPTSSPTRSRC